MSDTFDWDALKGIDWDEVAAATSPEPEPAPEPTATPAATDPAATDPVKEAEQQALVRAGEEVLEDMLRNYGLESLIPWAFEQLREDPNVEAIALRLRKTDEFKERFKGLEMRRAAGLPQITPAQYLNLERSYKQTLAAAGIPAGFYDEVDELAEFIGNDVSEAEFTERVALAASAVRSVNPELRGQLQDMYGIGVETDGELIAYYLDPDRAVSVIEQRLQFEAAGLSATAKRTIGQGFDAPFAEQLATANIQQREISDRMGRQAGLVQTRLLGENSKLTASEVAAAEFGFDPDSVANVRRLRKRRQEAGRRAGGAMASAGGIGGLGSSL